MCKTSNKLEQNLHMQCKILMGHPLNCRVDLSSRNTHDVIFRTVEIGVALWFPCVLWNCIRPEQLWCLNPKKILERMPPLNGASRRRRARARYSVVVITIPTHRNASLELSIVANLCKR